MNFKTNCQYCRRNQWLEAYFADCTSAVTSLSEAFPVLVEAVHGRVSTELFGGRKTPQTLLTGTC